MKNGLYLLLSLALVFSACSDDEPTLSDDEILSSYITDNNLDAIQHESGFYYVLEEEGTGNAHPDIFSEVQVEYKGYFTDGDVFDETTTTPAVFPLTGVIEGWQIAIPLLKKGGEGTFLFPSNLAYGTQGRGSIPPNTVLIFDIKLLDFN